MARPKGTKNTASARKTGPKGGGRGRVETVKELDLERIAYLLRMGYNQYEIAKDVNLSQPMISIHCKQIRARTLDSMIEDRKAMICQELNVIMDVRKKAEQALTLSEQGKKKRHHEVMDGGEGGGYEKSGTVEEGLLPPSEYMNVILKTNERICDMFGLDDAVKNIFNVTATQNTVIASPQDIVSMILGLRSKPDPVEEELKALEDLPAVNVNSTKDGD